MLAIVTAALARYNRESAEQQTQRMHTLTEMSLATCAHLILCLPMLTRPSHHERFENHADVWLAYWAALVIELHAALHASNDVATRYKD